MSSWLDLLPSHERARIRKRMRSPEAYERLREKVKGPEDLEEEMRHNEVLAELQFGLETEPALHEALKKQAEKDVFERGVENVFETTLVPEVLKAVKEGRFSLKVETNPATHEDALLLVPDGRVQETLPLKRSLSDLYAEQFLKNL